jgi:RNA polymerase sigma factor (sigma-70 family)
MMNMAVHRLTKVIQNLRRSTLPDEASVSDGQLLDQFIEHQDEYAFAALVRRHSPMVWGVCRRIVAHHQDAEDAFQATFLVLARKAASIRPRALVANWLYGVAHRTALKARTIAGKRHSREKQVIDMPEPKAVQHDSRRDLESLIDQELAALPDKYRVALLLCDLEGKTGREVARQLKIPEGTLASRLRTGRTMLAKRLARHGLAVSGGALGTLLSQCGVGAAPPTVVSMTIKTATLVAAGKTVAAGAVSAKVAALTEGVMKAMFLSKLKALMAVLVLAGGLGGTAGLTYQMQAAAQPGPQRVNEKPQPQPVADAKQRDKEKLEQADEKAQKAREDYYQAKASFEEARGELARAKENLEQALAAMTLAKNRIDLMQSGQNANDHPNFVVLAPAEDIARMIGEQAEAERKRLAKLWLGTELPPWERACLVHVTLAKGVKREGFTKFECEENRRFAPKQEMWLKGDDIKAILRDVLPQQVMHTLLAHELGVGHPRWIEAGAGFMAQSEQARSERLAMLPKAIADGKTMRLTKKWFEHRDYPSPGELETWYAQSLSVCEFLVTRKDRATLLAFAARGMERGWDDAVRRFYGFNDVDDLQAAWRKSVLDSPKKADKRLIRVIYPIADLLTDKDKEVQARDIIGTITANVGPDSWASYGGPGNIHFDTFGKALVVSQRQEIQQRVEEALESMRPSEAGKDKSPLQILLGAGVTQPKATIQGEVLKVHVAELSVSILVEADKRIVYFTSSEEKKGDATYRISDKTVVLDGGSKERMKFGQIKIGDRITIEVDAVKSIVTQIVVVRNEGRDFPIFDSRVFKLPVNLGRLSGKDIMSISLYVSSDEGATWKLNQSKPIADADRGFQVTVPNDGVYWFAVQTRSSTGVVTPTDHELRPNLKVRVDTAQSQR